VAAVIATAVAVPIGILAARHRAVSVVVRPVLDFMQTTPVFVYLIPAVFFFGVGVVPGVVATILFAIPPGVRLTELGIRQVDREVVEASQAFGARPGQVLREVQLPLALPSIMAGVNQVIMLALSMVVTAGLLGAAGLGAVVVRAVTQLDVGSGFEGGLAVVLLAVFLDRLTAAFGHPTALSRLLKARGRRTSAGGVTAGREPAAVGERQPA
jgi:ABC-type proline/glycine betaine transport system permease subunit